VFVIEMLALSRPPLLVVRRIQDSKLGLLPLVNDNEAINALFEDPKFQAGGPFAPLPAWKVRIAMDQVVV
jgi:hypothetical protein